MATNRISNSVSSNRKYDIDFTNWASSVEGVAGFTFGDLSKKTTGLVKVTNRFLNMLLSYKGSDPYDFNRGTYFDDIHNMGREDVNEIGTFVSVQIADAYAQVRDIQSKNSFPTDENIISATLTSIEKPTPETLKLFINIRVESGEDTTVVVPILGG